MIGEKMPLFVTALGRAYLAACSDTQRDALLALLTQRSDWIGDMARDREAVDAVIAETRERGYGFNNGEWIRESHFAAIAVPVLSGGGLLAALNMIFPKAAVSQEELEQRFLPALRRLAQRIGKGAESWLP
jgi:IclR family mhp operon transcriptional activator